MSRPSDPNNEYGQLLTAIQPRLHGFVVSLMPGDPGVEDVVQETNRVLWDKSGDFEVGTNFSAWAYTVARFQVMAYQKKRKRQSWLCFDDALVELFMNEATTRFEGIDDRRRALRTCLTKLRDSDRDIIRTRYETKHPLKVHAKRVGRTEAAVKRALVRIRERLRLCIENELEAPQQGGRA